MYTLPLQLTFSFSTMSRINVASGSWCFALFPYFFVFRARCLWSWPSPELTWMAPQSRGKSESEAKVPLSQTYPAYLCHFLSRKLKSTRMQLLNSHSSNKYPQRTYCVPGTTLGARTWWWAGLTKALTQDTSPISNVDLTQPWVSYTRLPFQP